MEKFDVIIIGFGKGGKTLATEFAAQGKKVAMVEKSDKMYGGACPNVGCVPTKFLVNKSEIAERRIHRPPPPFPPRPLASPSRLPSQQLLSTRRRRSVTTIAERVREARRRGRGRGRRRQGRGGRRGR